MALSVFELMGLALVDFGQEIMSLVCGLFVVERLLVRERRGRVEDMDHGGHVWMYEADNLEIAGGREHHIERLA